MQDDHHDPSVGHTQGIPPTGAQEGLEPPAGPENTKLQGEGHTEKSAPRKRSRLRFRKAKRKTSNGIHLPYHGSYIGFRKLYFSI